MTTQFIPLTKENILMTGPAIAPWAARVVTVNDGWIAFATWQDFIDWRDHDEFRYLENDINVEQKKNFPDRRNRTYFK